MTSDLNHHLILMHDSIFILYFFNRANTLFPPSHLLEPAVWMRLDIFFLSPTDCSSTSSVCMPSFCSILDSTKHDYLEKVKGNSALVDRFCCLWQERQWLSSPFCHVRFFGGCWCNRGASFGPFKELKVQQQLCMWKITHHYVSFGLTIPLDCIASPQRGMY